MFGTKRAPPRSGGHDPCMRLLVKWTGLRGDCGASLVSWFERERFFVPTTGFHTRCAEEPRSILAEGHRRRRRAAGLTAASAARNSSVRDEASAAALGRT